MKIMSLSGKQGMAEKVEEMKRRQANWMRERSFNITEGDNSVSLEKRLEARNSKERGTKMKKTKQPSKSGPETISWTINSNAPKKRPTVANNAAKTSANPQTLRTRSASPARSSSQKTNHPEAGSNRTSSRPSSRPSSAKSNASEGSRPPAGRKAALPHGDISSRSQPDRRTRKPHPGDHRDFQESPGTARQRAVEKLGEVPHRYNSEPNLNKVNRCNEDFAFQNRDQNGKMSESDDEGCHHDLDIIHSDQGDTRRRPMMPMEPNDFDRLADKISRTVKVDHDDDDESNGQIKGHHCSKCEQLMVPPDHAPTILIPCGHTFCEACSEDRIKCPTCRTRVTSTSLNSTLQDVIMGSSRLHQEQSWTVSDNPTPHHESTLPSSDYRPAKYTDEGRFHSRTTGGDVPMRETTEHGGTSDNVNSRRNEVPYSDDGRLHSRPDGGNSHLRGAHDDERTKNRVEISKNSAPKRRISPEEEARKIEEEYQSLGIRCEALESEEKDVLCRVEIQNEEITQHKHQIGNISQKQQQLRDEVSSLERRLADLEGHRQEYKRQVDDAEHRKQEELDQLAMVRTMLRDMQRSRERVKMSARKLNLSLD